MRFLLLPLENLLRDIARLVRLRPVDLRLHIVGMPWCGSASRPASPQDVRAHTLGFIRLDGARMRLLFGDPDRRESVQNFFALDFQLSR
jgi:hypothetical protein